MKCIIEGIEPKNYTNKNGVPVKGLQLFMSAENPNVIGRIPKDTFVSFDSPLYHKHREEFDDLSRLENREVEVEWDVQTFGSKQVKLLIRFDFTDTFYKRVKDELPEKPF